MTSRDVGPRRGEGAAPSRIRRRPRFKTVELRSGPVEPAHWHPQARRLLDDLPRGRQRYWGIPFTIVDQGVMTMTEPLAVVVDGYASHIVIAHTCDLSIPRQPSDRRPGQIIAVGESIADYHLIHDGGRVSRLPVRRRLEIGEVGTWWGHLAFGARPHRADGRLPDGPVPLERTGNQLTGVVQRAYEAPWGEPTPSWWIWSLPNPVPDRRIETLTIHPTGASPILLGAITLFNGTADPLRHRQAVVVRRGSPEASDTRWEVDLGVAGAAFDLIPPAEDGEPATPIGGGAVELAAAPDAIVTDGGRRYRVDDLEIIGQSVPPTRIRLVDDISGRSIPGRLSAVSPSGLPLPPVGHQRHIRDIWLHDQGADVLSGGRAYAYVLGDAEVEIPPEGAQVSAYRGLEYEPIRSLIQPSSGVREIRLRRVFDRGPRWMSADTHVHVLSPLSALHQADAEDVDLVNLLATQWGDFFTNVGDLGSPSILRRRGRSVVMGTENRQHLLGHLLLLGTGSRPVMPMAAGGPEESGVGDPASITLAEWATRGRRRSGLAIAPHFPEPYAEVVADALLGLVDAVELRYLGPHGDSMDLAAWYALLEVGIRVGCIGGTDKMSEGQVLGAVRTLARLREGERPTFGAFGRSVRAGRTIATNGPLIEWTADGAEPGERLERSGPANVRIEALVRSVIPTDRLELVVNGRAVAESSGGTLDALVHIEEPSWLAVRTRGSTRSIAEGWANTVAAHSSPVYVEIAGESRFSDSAADALDGVLVGALLWLDRLATRPSDARHEENRRSILRARRRLDRLRARRPTGRRAR